MSETCELCGTKVGKDDAYVREIHQVKYTFCCSHCADMYEMRATGHLHQ